MKNTNIAKVAMASAFTLLCALNANAAVVPIDLNTWSQQGASSNGNWTVAGDGQSVFQATNGNPTFFVSPDDFFNTTIKGSFGVETTSDDDYIGFVFGYQGPLAANGDATNDYEFLLFDWKQSNQNFSGELAEEGFALTKVDGVFTNFLPGFWGHNDSQEFDILATDFGSDRGWADNTVYGFELLFQNNRIKIDISGGTFGSGETIFDVAGNFQSGKFGFYNYSQPNVRYVGFTEEDTPPPNPVNAPTGLLLTVLALLGLARAKRRN